MTKDQTRRDFITKSTLAGMATLAVTLESCQKRKAEKHVEESILPGFIVPKANALPITGTFLGEISHDIPHQNWSENEWDADKFGMKCWTNAETFDRDMPIKFFPLKFDKLRLKLEAARRAGYDKAITFEFSHFMSPQSAYLQAGHLYDRYREYFNIS
jgi:hypothetical protein